MPKKNKTKRHLHLRLHHAPLTAIANHHDHNSSDISSGGRCYLPIQIQIQTACTIRVGLWL